MMMGTGAPGEAQSVSSGKKSHLLSASNSRLTRWKQLPATEALLAKSHYEPRSRFSFSSLSPLWHQEVDLLGIVLELGETQEFQIGNKLRHRCNLFLLDESEKVAVVCLELPLNESPQKQYKVNKAFSDLHFISVPLGGGNLILLFFLFLSNLFSPSRRRLSTS